MKVAKMKFDISILIWRDYKVRLYGNEFPKTSFKCSLYVYETVGKFIAVDRKTIEMFTDNIDFVQFQL